MPRWKPKIWVYNRCNKKRTTNCKSRKQGAVREYANSKKWKGRTCPRYAWERYQRHVDNTKCKMILLLFEKTIIWVRVDRIKNILQLTKQTVDKLPAAILLTWHCICPRPWPSCVHPWLCNILQRHAFGHFGVTKSKKRLKQQSFNRLHYSKTIP